MKAKTKFLISILSLVACLFAFATVSLAAEYTVSSADEFKTAFSSAVDGDTIVIKEDVSYTLDFGKSIKYILEADWSSEGAICSAMGKTVEIYSRGGTHAFNPTAKYGWWCSVTNLDTTTWKIGGIDGGVLNFDCAGICPDTSRGRLTVYGEKFERIDFVSGIRVFNIRPIKSSHNEDTWFVAKTINFYEDAKFYGNRVGNSFMLNADTFNMYGGEIYGNYSLYMNGGISALVFNMYGGSIYNNIQVGCNGSIGVSFVNAANGAYIYDGQIYGNMVEQNSANKAYGALACGNNSNKPLYLKDGAIYNNKTLVSGFTVAFNAENSLWEITSKTTDSAVSNQYANYAVSSFKYSLIFKNADSSAIEAFMIKENGDILKSLLGSEEIVVPEGDWSSVKGSCDEVSPVTTAQATYYVAHVMGADDFNCATAITCQKCSAVLVEAISHVADEKLTYGSFCSNGTYVFECTNDGCSALDGTYEKDPLFVLLGFSVTEVEMGGNGVGMTQSFYINYELIAEYERLNGVTISYGVVAAGKDNIGGNPLMLVDGVVTKVDDEKVISYEVVESNRRAVEIKIVGIDPEKTDHTSAQLIYCGYVSDGNKIWYLDNGSAYENAVSRSYQEALETQNAAS